MSVLFESVLLFSLAVLILLVGCLVYYFKKRIVDIEQKTAKCLEITQDVYMQQIQFKNEVYSILFPPQQQHQYIDERIRVELSEDEKSELDSDSESESESESDSDSESDEKVKVVSVDLSFPEECDIHINDESESEEEIYDEPEPEIVQLNDSEPIVVSKIEESAPPKKPISKDELQKMSLATLKSLLITKGVSAESVNKMKKKDLVDALSA
jgi:hypothetical protein